MRKELLLCAIGSLLLTSLSQVNAQPHPPNIAAPVAPLPEKEITPAEKPVPAASSTTEQHGREEILNKIAEDQAKANETLPREEAKRQADQEAQENLAREKATALKLAQIEKAKEKARKQLEQEQQCVIKPVMTDADIALCKKVWR